MADEPDIGAWTAKSWVSCISMLTSLGKAIGLGFGTGLSPVAPGTAGSLAAVALFYGLFLLLPPQLVFAPLFLWSLDGSFLLAILIVVGLPLGIWATGLLVTDNEPDPGRAVWDEFVGMWITCLPVSPEPVWLAIAFVWFRIFDVLKPWPARRLEGLHGGLGIMADDVAAGAYGAAVMVILQLIWASQFLN